MASKIVNAIKMIFGKKEELDQIPDSDQTLKVQEVSLYSTTEIDNLLDEKQNTLIAGCNIVINEDNVIYAPNNVDLVYVNPITIGTCVSESGNGISIGQHAYACSFHDIGIGYYANAYDSSVALGTSTTGCGGSIAIGNYVCSYDSSVALGTSTTGCGGSIAIGNSVYSYCNSVSLGECSYAMCASVSIGVQAQASEYNVAIGELSIAYDACIYSDSYGSLSIGYASRAYDSSINIGSCAATCCDSVGIGLSRYCVSNSSVAIGNRGSSTNNSVSVGTATDASDNSIAIGAYSSAYNCSIVIGENSTVSQTGSIVLGNNIFCDMCPAYSTMLTSGTSSEDQFCGMGYPQFNVVLLSNAMGQDGNCRQYLGFEKRYLGGDCGTTPMRCGFKISFENLYCALSQYGVEPLDLPIYS